MITTITFFSCAWVTGVGVGEGDEEEEDFTPPQPMIRARRGTVKKNTQIRLKVSRTSLGV
jgi:hypothetical protein